VFCSPLPPSDGFPPLPTSFDHDHVSCRYTYSLVFTQDMYESVPLDPEVGKLYRDKILLVGGSRDDMDWLKVSWANVG
jgi:hypothetical protein